MAFMMLRAIVLFRCALCSFTSGLSTNRFNALCVGHLFNSAVLFGKLLRLNLFAAIALRVYLNQFHSKK